MSTTRTFTVEYDVEEGESGDELMGEEELADFVSELVRWWAETSRERRTTRRPVETCFYLIETNKDLHQLAHDVFGTAQEDDVSSGDDDFDMEEDEEDDLEGKERN